MNFGDRKGSKREIKILRCGVFIIWQMFCEPARLRIANCLSMCVLWESSHCCEYHRICDSISIANIRNPGKSVNCLLLLVIRLPLCQTSCPLRTVHYFQTFKTALNRTLRPWVHSDPWAHLLLHRATIAGLHNFNYYQNIMLIAP